MSTPRRSDVDSAARHWDQAFQDFASIERQETTYTLASTLFQEHHVNPRFGPDAPNWVEGLRRRLDVRAPAERALVLGSGLGEGLFHLVHGGFVRRVHGIDIAPKAIEAARASAVRHGLERDVTFEVGDFHECALEEGAFDLVLMVMSLHHALDLERVLARIVRALKPAGACIVNEYVGPDRWQFTARQLVLVNAMLAMLPRRLRRKGDGTHKPSLRRPTIAQMIAMDPSEAAHSADIPAAFARHFELLVRVDYGGGVAVPVLDEIIANFRADDPASMAWFRRILWLDRFAERTGLVPSANAFLVGRPR